MRKSTNLAIAIGAGLCFTAIAQADDLRFTTLPQTVQTTVSREMRILDASRVTRMVRESSGIYVVTVQGTTGEQVVYMNAAGLIVQAPVISTTAQNSVETVLSAIESSQKVVTYDQVQQTVSRYQLLEKKGTKEVYWDNRVGQKVIVKRENN
jgi:hypothetical protein